MNAQAEVRFLRWLLRRVFPHLDRTTPPELLEHAAGALLRVAMDQRERPVTFPAGSLADH